MMPSNNRSTKRWRNGVALTSLLKGLVVLLILTTVSCGVAEPDDPVDPVATVVTPTPVPEPANVAPPEYTVFSGNGAWVLESLDGNPIIDESFVRIKIGEDRFTGYDGCNWITGYSEHDLRASGDFQNGVFSLPYQLASTVRLCHEPSSVMEQAEAFTSALFAGETYRVTDDRLEIMDSDGDVRLTFLKQMPLAGRPIDLNGTAWQLVNEDVHAKGGVNAATVAFVDDRLAIGETACRPYLATYSRSEEEVRFHLQSMLERSILQSCSDEERRLEGDFGDFISTNEYAVQEEPGSTQLRMRSTTGKTMTFEQLPPIVEDIADVEWVLVALIELRQDELGMWLHRKDEASGKTDLTLSFHSEGISGSMACNSYRAEANVDNDSFTINAETFFYTEIECDVEDRVMEQQERYLEILPDVTRYGVYGDHLILQANDDFFLLFRPQ